MLEALGIWFALLFVTWVIGASVWDAWALGDRWQRRTRKRLEPKAAPVMELDFSAKRKRRDEEHIEWSFAFVRALGEDRESFVAEWATGSRRVVLADRLKAAWELAVKERRTSDMEELMRMRHKVAQNPGQPIPERLMLSLQEHLRRIETKAAADRVVEDALWVLRG